MNQTNARLCGELWSGERDIIQELARQDVSRDESGYASGILYIQLLRTRRMHMTIMHLLFEWDWIGVFKAQDIDNQ